MQLRLLRHATLSIRYGGASVLLDPMLSAAGARAAVEDTPNPRRNPLVELPIPVAEILKGVDAVLVTHTHSDHFDDGAAQFLPRGLPLLGQPPDEAKFRGLGFTSVQSIADQVTFRGITISRTGGQHGTGEIGRNMAPVSGFVLQAPGEPVLYIAGDTIFCAEVTQALERFHPDVVVVNAGGARFLQGDPITMTPEDVIQTCRALPKAGVVAVHMEAINHCIVTRADLAFQLEAERLTAQVAIPADGEVAGLG